MSQAQEPLGSFFSSSRRTLSHLSVESLWELSDNLSQKEESAELSIYLFCLFIYLFIYLSIYLFI